MKRSLCAVVALAVGMWGQQVLSQTNQTGVHTVSSKHAIRIVPSKNGCCPCLKRWPFPQIQNVSFQLVEGQPLVFQIEPGGWKDAYISVKNVSAETVTFSVRMDTSRKDPNHRVNFCSGQACYPTFVTEADQQGYVTLQPGQEDHTFKLQFDTQGYSGQSVIGVTIFNIANLSDYISFDVTFDANVLSVDESHDRVFVSPNPAGEHVQVHAAVGAQVQIVDMLGRTVRQTRLQSSPATLPVTELPVGAYRVIVQSATTVVSIPLQVLR